MIDYLSENKIICGWTRYVKIGYFDGYIFSSYITMDTQVDLKFSLGEEKTIVCSSITVYPGVEGNIGLYVMPSSGVHV